MTKRRLLFTDDQLSMVLSALAGDQPLCCGQHAANRETIAETPAQVAALTAWANQHVGCRLGKGLINEAAWKAAARQRYLDSVGQLETLETGKRWSGLCLAGKHGLDFEGQVCDLCARDRK